MAPSGVPAGWNSIAAVTAQSSTKVYGYVRTATSIEPSQYTWTLSSAVRNGAGMVRYGGVNTTTPLAGPASSASAGSGTSATLPGVTAFRAGDMLVGCLGINANSLALGITSPAGMTQVWDIGGKRHEVADQPLSSGGATGSRIWSISASRAWAGWLAVLRAR
jgi:hypothetical protein